MFNFDVALEFPEPTSTKHGLILQINRENLHADGKLVFCDISWISEFPDEFEILIAPCMLNIDPIDFSHQKKSEIKIVGADVAAIKPTTEIMSP